MKTYIKFIIVFVSMGLVGGFSFLISVKPDMAVMLSAVNTAILAISSFVTGYPSKEA